MKNPIPLLLVLFVAGAIGYAIGTGDGRPVMVTAAALLLGLVIIGATASRTRP